MRAEEPCVPTIRRVRTAVAVALVVGAAALAGCGGTEVAKADVGDCFQDPENTAEVDEFDTVDCDEPHDNEVYAVFDLPDGDFPGADMVDEDGVSGCIERFEGYVGAPYETSDLDIYFIFPTEETWERADDREVICAVFAIDGSPLDGSAEGSGR